MERPPTDMIDVEEDVIRRHERIRGMPVLHDVLQTIPSMTILLDTQGRIVHANRRFMEELERTDIRQILGLLPGMALRCVHALTSEGGCGTGSSCRFCGAFQTVVDARTRDEAVGEMRLLRKVDGRQEPVDLRLSCRRLDPDGENLILVAMADITDETRRQQLERAFFHDLLNTANVLRGLSWTLHNATPTPEVTGLLQKSVNQLTDEIRIQRVLARGGSREQATEVTTIDASRILDDIVGQYRNHLVARDRNLEIDAEGGQVAFESDPALLMRVVGNLVKNALEASEAGQTVTVGHRVDGDHIEFRVHNTTVMPEDVQHQIFKRSFSTKGAGRGIGTYSVKLFTEHYLGGEAAFTSTKAEGTTFRVRYPLRASPARDTLASPGHDAGT
jgi:signal transduction histidine kinase